MNRVVIADDIEENLINPCLFELLSYFPSNQTGMSDDLKLRVLFLDGFDRRDEFA